MVGLHIPIPDATFTGSDAPTLPAFDPVAPDDGVGALLLIEANHPLGGNFTVPTNGAAITNLFRDTAADLLGVAASTLDPIQAVGNMTSTFGKVELTTLGGIHAIQSTTQGTTTSSGYQIRFPRNIVDYMKANLTHAFYVSVWNMPTKLISPAPGTSLLTSMVFPYGAMYSIGLGNPPNLQAGRPGSVTKVGGQNDSTRGTLNTPQCSVQAVICNCSDWETSDSTITVWQGMFEVGNFAPANRSGKNGARVLWRAYIEDLTVSGRSYADVVALDNAEFARQVTTEGGRYYGDTVVTDPATFT